MSMSASAFSSSRSSASSARMPEVRPPSSSLLSSASLLSLQQKLEPQSIHSTSCTHSNAVRSNHRDLPSPPPALDAAALADDGKACPPPDERVGVTPCMSAAIILENFSVWPTRKSRCCSRFLDCSSSSFSCERCSATCRQASLYDCNQLLSQRAPFQAEPRTSSPPSPSCWPPCEP